MLGIAEIWLCAEAKAVTAAETLWGKLFTTSVVSTGVWEDIYATQGNYAGSVLPKSFELSVENGTKVWVHGNATEHMAEYLTSVAEHIPPNKVRLITQQLLKSLQSSVNAATQNGVVYNKLMEVGGWELKFSAPRQAGQLPALIHALPK